MRIPGLAAGICKQHGVRVSRRLPARAPFFPTAPLSSFPFYSESGWEMETELIWEWSAIPQTNSFSPPQSPQLHLLRV